MKIILIRHGKTLGNTERKYIGQRTDEAILEEEVRRADTLKKRLLPQLEEDYKAFSSPMLRCQMTAEILFGKKSFGLCQDFREIDFGIFEGKNYQELISDDSTKGAYQIWIDSDGRAAFPQGEARETFEKRSYRQFCHLVKAENAASMLAVVCHGGTIMSIMSKLTGKNYYDFLTDNLNGYFLEIEVNKGEINALSYCRLDDWISAGSDNR